MRLRVPLSVAIGFGLILLGTGGRATIDYWMKTRIVRPVDMPVSLALGHIRTAPFRLNLDTDYWVELDPDTDSRWDSAHPECNPYRHLKTRWTLYKNGKVFDRLDEPTVLPWPSGFRAGPGAYELDVEVMSDFTCLDGLPPRLRVVANTEHYETVSLFMRASLSCVTYIGFVCLIFVPIIRFVYSYGHAESDVGEAPVSQHFRWAQRLPLRRPISGLPGFGLVSCISFALIAAVMMVITGFRPSSQGFRVRLLKQGTVPKNDDMWTEPLVVRVKDAGTGKAPKLYVNSKLVAEQELDHALKQELSRRRGWIIYVDGDDNVAWQDVVHVIDVARGEHATVYLITQAARPHD